MAFLHELIKRIEKSGEVGVRLQVIVTVAGR